MVDELNIELGLTMIADYLKPLLVAELETQGHQATGDLIESIDHTIRKEVGAIILEGKFLDYGSYVERGRRAKAKRVPLDALIEWIKQKGFESDAKKVRGLAFAIQKKIFDVGISTPDSWKGETTKNWLSKTLNSQKQKITNDIKELITKEMMLIITNMVELENWRTKITASHHH